jgi:hypothetical protein
VRFNPDRFRATIHELREIKIPEPGDPPFFVRVELLSELSEGTLVTLFSGDQVIGRAVVRNGVADIVPEAGGDRRNLSISLQQDGALPAPEPIENPPPTEQTSLQSTTRGALRKQETRTRSAAPSRPRSPARRSGSSTRRISRAIRPAPSSIPL